MTQFYFKPGMKWGTLFSSGPQWASGQQQLSAQRVSAWGSMQTDLEPLAGTNESPMLMGKYLSCLFSFCCCCFIVQVPLNRRQEKAAPSSVAVETAILTGTLHQPSLNEVIELLNQPTGWWWVLCKWGELIPYYHRLILSHILALSLTLTHLLTCTSLNLAHSQRFNNVAISSLFTIIFFLLTNLIPIFVFHCH